MWINDGPFYWCIYASFGLTELTLEPEVMNKIGWHKTTKHNKMQTMCIINGKCWKLGEISHGTVPSWHVNACHFQGCMWIPFMGGVLMNLIHLELLTYIWDPVTLTSIFFTHDSTGNIKLNYERKRFSLCRIVVFCIMIGMKELKCFVCLCV